MKLYHYAPSKNTILTDGLLSVSRLPSELKKYADRARSINLDRIKSWLNETFPGRDRAISVLTEPVRWKGCDPMLKRWLDKKILISIDLDKLMQDGLVESVWCKEKSDKNGQNEIFKKITANQIDSSPLSWKECSAEKGLFFGVIRHYFLVLKKGIIPPAYLTMEGNK